jgi:hypothetical protein
MGEDMHSLTKLSVLVVTAATLALPRIADAQDAKPLFFEADTVRHALEGQAGPFCVQGNQYKRKEAVAWRIRVLDQTGKSLDDKGLKSVVVQLGDGQKLEAKWGGHPPRGTPTDFFWSLHWVIPADYPTGSLGFKIVATDLDGRTQTWEPFKRAPTQLTVIAGEPALKQN